MALAAPDLANVRDLYAAASYAEALEVLGGVEGTDNTEVVEQYRALCLLGLGRTADAEKALERSRAAPARAHRFAERRARDGRRANRGR